MDQAVEGFGELDGRKVQRESFGLTGMGGRLYESSKAVLSDELST